jgi:hypothetical protein
VNQNGINGFLESLCAILFPCLIHGFYPNQTVFLKFFVFTFFSVFLKLQSGFWIIDANPNSPYTVLHKKKLRQGMEWKMKPILFPLLYNPIRSDKERDGI